MLSRIAGFGGVGVGGLKCQDSFIFLFTSIFQAFPGHRYTFFDVLKAGFIKKTVMSLYNFKLLSISTFS